MDNGDPRNELRKKTREVFKPRAGRLLSNEDLREIAQNLTGFFRVLGEWAYPDVDSGGEGEPTNSTPATVPITEPSEEREPDER